MLLPLPSTLTHQQANGTLATLLAAVAQEGGAGLPPGCTDKRQLTHPEAAVLDGSALKTFDSSALAVLLEFCRQASMNKMAVQIQNFPKHLEALARVYGVAGLLGIPVASSSKTY